MIDNISNINVLHSAKAQITLHFSSKSSAELTQSTDIFSIAKTTALLAIKKTSDIFPNTLSKLIDFAKIDFQVEENVLEIEVTVKSIAKNSIETEAMFGASVAALTVYDAFKNLDSAIEIKDLKLIEKKGLPSELNHDFTKTLTVAVVVCSDSVSDGAKEDKSGKIIVEKLSNFGIYEIDYSIIPDEIDEIQAKTLNLVAKNFNLIVFTGGTGLSPRDRTPEALIPLLDREIPGIAEAVRNYGQNRTPYSMLSRSVAGMIKSTLILALPGSTKGAEESIDAIFPHILHIFRVLKGGQH